jgi:mono/diheme cytochrome c family protein
MRTSATLSLAFGCLVALLPAVSAFAGDRMDIGKREYEQSCAACHGLDGKGKAPFAEAMQLPVSDLTALARRNGGVFPVARVYDVIDGREAVKAHGSRDMPIWGMHYSASAAPRYDDYAYNPEAAARARILALIDYLYRIQAK